MQAIRDILILGYGKRAMFDHLQFPGVVPRTFIGAIVISFLSSPLKVMLIEWFDMDGFTLQMACRMVLGFVVWHSTCKLADSLLECLHATQKQDHANSSGKSVVDTSTVRNLYFLLMATSFHFPFYASRSLPNTFAVIGCNYAFSYWFSGREPMRALYFLCFTTLVFRCDMLVLVGPMVLLMLLSGEISFASALPRGVLAAITSIAVTVAIDSPLWNRYTITAALLYPPHCL